MGRIVETTLFKGFVDTHLSLIYGVNVELEGKFAVIKENEQYNSIDIRPGHCFKIFAGNPVVCLFITTRQFYPFMVLFDKIIKLTQENLFELFPNVGNTEFDINDSVLERFQKEKALSTANLTMMPALYTNSTGECSPGIRISLENKVGAITIPLEDAIGMNRCLKTFDPNNFTLQVLNKLLTIE